MPDTNPIPTRRGRPPALEQSLRRSRLLQVASTEFATSGFDGATIDAVAAASGVSKATIYSQFGGKEGLFRAITSWACRVPGDALAAVQPEGRAPQAVLLEFSTAIRDNMHDLPALALLRLTIFEQPRFPEIAAAVFAASLETIRPLTEYLVAQIAQNQFAAADPETLALRFVALSTGGYQGLLRPQALPDPEEVVAFFLRGVGQTAPPARLKRRKA